MENNTEDSKKFSDYSETVQEISSESETISRSTAVTACVKPIVKLTEDGNGQVNPISPQGNVVSEDSQNFPSSSSSSEEPHTWENNDANYSEGSQNCEDHTRINQNPSSSRISVSSHNYNTATALHEILPSNFDIRSLSTVSLDSSVDQSDDENPQSVNLHSSAASIVAVQQGNEELTEHYDANPSLENGVQRAPRIIHIQPNQLITSPLKPKNCTCQYRSPFMKLSPPCYFCSTTDRPPKYKETDSFNWKETKGKLLGVFRTLARKNPTQQGPSTSSEFSEMNNNLFTISDGRFQGSSHSNHGETYNSSNNPSVAQQESQFNTAEAQRIEINITESGSNRCLQSGRLGNFSGNSNGNIALHTVSRDPPPYLPGDTGIPPPYSPPTPSSFVTPSTHDHWISEGHWQNDYDFTRVHLIRNCQCNVFYSLLLATVTTLAIFGTEPPIPLLSCGIIFFTFLVYMPVIWFLEKVIRWRPWEPMLDRVPPFSTVD
ncbi:uncharacterized protein [Palaemon carinicauda]|uniref:uncharacterized protein n=1 Tax=Palaemon carinicauda TaxID=392227 RepID=UPI0035B619D4